MRLAQQLAHSVTPLCERKPTTKRQSGKKSFRHKNCVSPTATYARYKKAFRGEKITVNTLGERLKVDPNTAYLWCVKQEKLGNTAREKGYRDLWYLTDQGKR